MNDHWEATAADSDQPRTGRGGKLARSVTVTVRFDPRLHYLAELAARKQRRTLSSFVEWAIEDTLGRLNIYEGWDGRGHQVAYSFNYAATELWDVDEADRFTKLAFRYPDLLTHTEQVAWKLIKENGLLWRGNYSGTENRWTWVAKEPGLIAERLHEHWDTFKRVARSEADKSELPTWAEYKVEPPPIGEDDEPPNEED